MPRVHFVKSARKADKAYGIAKGDSYYYWTFRVTSGKSYISRKMKSKTRPKSSQLTQSEFLQGMYGNQEELEQAIAAFHEDKDFEDFASALETIAEQVREIGENEQSKFDSLPEGFQQGESGQKLEERANACETIADELESAASEIRDAKPDEDKTDDGKKDVAEELETAIADASDAAENVSWDFE